MGQMASLIHRGQKSSFSIFFAARASKLENVSGFLDILSSGLTSLLEQLQIEMDHPLNTHGAPFSSPPDSPKEERDMEQGFKHAVSSQRNNTDQLLLAPEMNYAGDFLSNAISSASSSDRDPLLLKSKLQSEESITELRRRKSGRSKKNLGSFYSRQNAQVRICLAKK